MNKTERLKMVSAMEFIARQINDEDVFVNWLVNAVADGDIEYGKMCDDEWYIDDNCFADIMDTFLMVMYQAYESGGLYCDGIVSRANSDY